MKATVESTPQLVAVMFSWLPACQDVFWRQQTLTKEMLAFWCLLEFHSWYYTLQNFFMECLLESSGFCFTSSLRGTSHGASSRTSKEDGLGPPYCNHVVLYCNQLGRVHLIWPAGSTLQCCALMKSFWHLMRSMAEHVLVSNGFGWMNQTQKSATPHKRHERFSRVQLQLLVFRIPQILLRPNRPGFWTCGQTGRTRFTAIRGYPRYLRCCDSVTKSDSASVGGLTLQRRKGLRW